MARFISSRLPAVSLAAAGLAVSACGGGGDGSSSATPLSGPADSSIAVTAGVWKGSIVSTSTGQSSPVVALTGFDGHSVWMAADGRVWSGQVPSSGDHFDATFSGHMYDGQHFPDGTNHGTYSMMVDRHSTAATSGRFMGTGDAGSFSMNLSPMWKRPAALDTVAGVYTRSTSAGYTMTMTISANGQLSGSDSKGCVVGGTVGVPDPVRNLYRLDVTVTSCGSMDGTYRGMGALLDADAMRDWMSAMHPLEQGGHTHGGPMMGGPPMMGGNTVPTGQRNLFMFSIVNDRNAIMDALAR